MKLRLDYPSVAALRVCAFELQQTVPMLENSSRQLLNAFSADDPYAGPHILQIEEMAKSITDKACLLLNDAVMDVSKVMLLTAQRIEDYLSSSPGSPDGAPHNAAMQPLPHTFLNDEQMDSHVR